MKLLTEMDKQFHSTLYYGWYYLSQLGLKLLGLFQEHIISSESLRLFVIFDKITKIAEQIIPWNISKPTNVLLGKAFASNE